MEKSSSLHPLKSWILRDNERILLDPDIFVRLYETKHVAVFRYIYGLSGGPLQEAEDLTAEVFTRAWKTRHKFSGNEQAALGWFLQIGRNLVIDKARRPTMRNTLDDDFPNDLPGLEGMPETDTIAREQASVLWQMLAGLPNGPREILVLRYILGWKVNQIARYLKKPENTVSANIHRALDRLQRNWPQS